jgi:molecular chaperone GrpE
MIDDTKINNQELSTDIVELAACQVEVQQLKEQVAYLQADMQNIQRRMVLAQATMLANAEREWMLALLPVVDNMNRAIADLHVLVGQQESLGQRLAGFELVNKEFQKFLDTVGIKVIDQVKVFDPMVHEAVMNAPVDEQHPDGAIVTIFEAGYMIRGHVLRPTRVSVARAV